MQDRYAGDIGDFGKFGLLKALLSESFSLGVNWYSAEPPKSERDKDTGTFLHEDGKHKINPKYFVCDDFLARALREISESDVRSIARLEQAALLDPRKTVYYHKVVSVDGRRHWHNNALQTLAPCEIAFLDPDNGLNVRSCRKGSAKSVKYVWDEELCDYLRRGQSVVLYNHRPRKKLRSSFQSSKKDCLELKGSPNKPVSVLTCPKGTVRDYFLIAANAEQAVRISSALCKMLSGPWGKQGLCRIEKFEG